MNHVTFSSPVPYYAQIATPDLAQKVFSGKMSAMDDPAWAETGAETVEEYAYWVERACGIVCVKMCVEAMGGRKENLMYWIKRGLDINGYLIRKNENDEEEEIGWIHSKLARLIQEEGFSAEALPADIGEISKHIMSDHLIVASVTYQLGTWQKITKNYGHLVVIHGQRSERGYITGFYVNNPSGRCWELRKDAYIPVQRFAEGFSGRVIVVSR